MTIREYLSSKRYPGRFLLAGVSSKGEEVLAYAIMGRSENSRNRIFTLEDGVLRTKAYDESKVEDPSLIIYNAKLEDEEHIVLTNGDQSDTIMDALKEGNTLEDALIKRTYEPDGPNYTPRISAFADIKGGALSYGISILKSAHGDPDSCQRFFYEYDCPLAGEGHLIHTYAADGDPLPSFSGEPVCFAVTSDDPDVLARDIWAALDPENKVSLFVRTVSLDDGTAKTVLLNKNLGE